MAYTPRWAKYFRLPDVITVHWIMWGVEEIRDAAHGDPGKAHRMEDELYQLVVWCIGRPVGSKVRYTGWTGRLCRELLNTRQIDFVR